jgi:DNA recombination protein RmuC
MPASLLPLIYVTLGFVLGFIIAKLKYKGRTTSSDLKKDYIPKAQFEEKELQLQKIEAHNRSLSEELIELNKDNATLEANLNNLQENLTQQKEEILKLNKQAQLQFKELANSILQEKSETFKRTNQEALKDILKPLKEKIGEFEQGIERKFTQDAKDKGALTAAINSLKELNTQLSQDALSLTKALKGDSKAQGDWGEIQLEQLLEVSGLQKGIHFKTQNSYKDKEGLLKRPDFIVDLPENRCIIIDSKVSLTAYERYCATEDPKEQKVHIKQHIESIKGHIKGLHSKTYEHLEGLNTVDYVMLYVPIEPALSLAMTEQNDLYQFALDKNIILVSNTTLLATMRTVSFIWKKQSQEKNALKIAKEAGQLYDKFIGFVEDLNELGQQLQKSNKSFDRAMNKLSESPIKGKTILGKIENLKELGAETNKSLPVKQQEDLGLN